MTENTHRAWNVPIDHPGVESLTGYGMSPLDAKADVERMFPHLETTGRPTPKERDDARIPPKDHGLGTGKGMDFSE